MPFVGTERFVRTCEGELPAAVGQVATKINGLVPIGSCQDIHTPSKYSIKCYQLHPMKECGIPSSIDQYII